MRALLASLIILLVAWTFWVFGSQKSESYYPRVQLWIESARCAKANGHLLVICDPTGAERPIEDVSLADDRGHALILSLSSRLLGFDPSVSSLRTINLTINFFSFALLTLLLNRKFGWKAALFTAILGAFWIGSRAGPDVDAAYIGISALTLSAVLTGISKRISWSAIACVFLILSFVVLIRQPIGLGAALSIAIGAALMIKKKEWLRPAVLILAAGLSLKMAAVPSAVRNAVLGMNPTGVAAHGFSHNLFLGLGGYVTNKWGIVWDDNYAKELVQKTHPEIAYCSDEYFKEIGRIYWKDVSSDPKEAARVYLVKAGRVLSAAGPMTLPSFALLIIWAAVSFFANKKMPRRKLDKTSAIVISTAALFGFSFLAQGILTHPAWTYIHPGPVILMLCVVMTAVRLLDHEHIDQPTTSRTA